MLQDNTKTRIQTGGETVEIWGGMGGQVHEGKQELIGDSLAGSQGKTDSP